MSNVSKKRHVMQIFLSHKLYLLVYTSMCSILSICKVYVYGGKLGPSFIYIKINYNERVINYM